MTEENKASFEREIKLEQQLADMTKDRNWHKQAYQGLVNGLADTASLQATIAQLQATLAAREAERDDERRKLQDVCMAHGPALMKIHDLERELKRLQLTWTTAQPTVAGWYWWRSPHRGDEVAYIFMGGGKNRKRFYVSYLGLDESPPELDHVLGEWAGPIPLPTEAQQASGRSGGAEGHGGQP